MIAVNCWRKNILIVIVFFTLSLLGEATADSNKSELTELSLEELMNLEISFGTFTGIEMAKFPGMMTVITEEDIRLTPARNVLDLIEIYVPGATYVTHYQGHRLGIRGILSDQNYSYQLLINGKNLNLKSYYGPLFELQEKDLNSIEKIEIISGSGSAIYGPGATAGIINIITKKPIEKHFSLATQYNLQYRYHNISFQYSDFKDSFKYYLYGSISRSKGLEDTKFWYIDRAQRFSDNQPYGWGYMGPDWGNYGLGSNAPSFYNDYLNEPEIKLHLDLHIGEDFTFWSRYSTYNHTLITQKSVSSEGPAFRGQLAKYFASELKYRHTFIDKFNWTSKLGYSSKNLRHIKLYQRDALSINHIAQRGNSFSENEVIFNTILTYLINPDYKFALGGEAAYTYYAPEWGMDDDSFILSFQSPIRFAVMNENSGFYKYYGEPIANVIKDDIDGRLYSLFGEANLKFHKRFQTLISFRADKHEYSDLALSPRIAVISAWAEKHIFELILERSVRMPLFTDLYAQHYLGGEVAKPEIMTGAEFKYIYQPHTNIFFENSAYYYTVEQISWIDANRFTDVIGTFDLFGVEPEIRYQNEQILTGANYSYIRQMNWEPGLDQQAWISGANGEKIIMSDFGKNRINNLPAHSFKLFMNYKLRPEIVFHLDGRVMWGYQQQDMLDQFEKAHAEYGNRTTMRVMDQIIDDLHDHGYAKPSFTSNISVTWKLFPSAFDIDLRCYVMNLFSYNHVRYAIQFWETGDVRQYPRQAGFIKEPLNFGLNLKFKL